MLKMETRKADFVKLAKPLEQEEKKYTHGIVVDPHDIMRGKLIAVSIYPYNPLTGDILIGEDGTPESVAYLLEELLAFKVDTPGKGKGKTGKKLGRPPGSGKKGKDDDKGKAAANANGKKKNGPAGKKNGDGGGQEGAAI